MSETTKTPPLVWVGRALSALPALMLVGSGGAKVASVPDVVTHLGELGFSASTVPLIGAIELTSVVLYLVPQTAVLGAILIAAYLGGATCIHVQTGDGQWPAPVVIGMMAWAGLALRDSRLRELLPLRRS